MAFRDIVCEILLRDVENLLEKYLIKTRKVSHMWYYACYGSYMLTTFHVVCRSTEL